MAELPSHGLDLRLQDMDLVQRDSQGLLLDLPATMMAVKTIPDLLVIAIDDAIPLLQVLHQFCELLGDGLEDILQTIGAITLLGHSPLEVVELCLHSVDLSYLG